MRERMTHTPDTNPSTATDSPKARGGKTVMQQGENQHGVPRMPHERDESADSQENLEPHNEQMALAAQKDMVRGLADTTKAAELDATYTKLRESVPDGDKKFRP